MAAILGGCGTVSAEFATGAALEHAGYRNVNMNDSTGSGVPRGGVVSVTYSRGPSGNDRQDGQDAARIVWRTLHIRFGYLVISRRSRGCAGSFCASRTTDVYGAPYAQLAAEFGPRPRDLNASAPGNSLSIPPWVAVLAIVLMIGAVAAVIMAVIVIRRRSPRPGPTQDWLPPSGPSTPPV
jgi:hypothetical protein